jgi:hypothetical protein
MDTPLDAPGPASVLGVGDPRRAQAGRAVLGTLATALSFLGFVLVGKEIGPVYARVPWADDPYDAIVSFAMFFLPLLAGLALVRVVLCRVDEPLPVTRITGLLRASNLMLCVVLVTGASDWTSVALREHAADWDLATGIMVGLLAVGTVAAARATVDLRRASRELPRRVRDAGGPDCVAEPGDARAAMADEPDWLADALALSGRWSAKLGPLAPSAGRVLRALDRIGTPIVRRHPIGTAALISVAFGLAVGAGAAREEGLGAIMALFFGVAACGMFAFLVAAGSYLGVIRAERPLRGNRRRLADAVVLAAAAVPVALAFRGSLLWVVGSSEADAGVAQLAGLLGVAAMSTFALVLAAEALAGINRPAP